MNKKESNQQNDTRPNILIILSDQLRRHAISCYGDPNARTPHIDKLAQNGVRFANSYSERTGSNPWPTLGQANFNT